MHSLSESRTTGIALEPNSNLALNACCMEVEITIAQKQNVQKIEHTLTSEEQASSITTPNAKSCLRLWDFRARGPCSKAGFGAEAPRSLWGNSEVVGFTMNPR